MPQNIRLEDGTEREIFTPEEVANLTKEKEDALKKMEEEKELLKQEANPNWAEARKKLKAQEVLIETLKAEGKTVSEEGKIMSTTPSLSAEDIQKIAQKEAQKLAVESIVTNHLSSLTTQEQQLVRGYFGRLTAGIDLTVDQIQGHLDAAFGAASIVPPSQRRTNLNYNLPSSYSPTQTGAPVAESTLEMGKLFGNSKEDLAMPGDVSDLLLKK